MTEAGKVGIATFVMRGKEHLCAIRPDGEKLVLSTMRYADEIRAADEIEELDAVTAAELSDKEVAMAEQLIASLEATFDPARFEDHYREKVLELVTRKESGEEGVVEAPEPADDDRVIDLMAALRASVEGAKAARRRHPTGDAAEVDADADDEAEVEEAAPKARGKKATAKKAPAKKAAAKKTAKTAAARKSA
jgi:DNA end-binding protein Ku